jgi:hypothetical protein
MSPRRSARGQPLRSFIRLAAAALAPLAFSLACSAPAPAPARLTRPALPRLSWYLRSGATRIDCNEPSYDCDDIGLEKCEAECADGEMPDCVALAAWQGHNLARGGDAARGLSLLRVACGKGFGPGCVALAAHPAATARDRATIAATLAPACASGNLCGCTLHGIALTFDAQGGARGIELLSDSCARGALDACDGLALLREICERDHSRASHCARIYADLRAPWSPPTWPSAELPASLQGCFRVAAQVETPDGERCVSLATAEKNGWSRERGDVCPRDGSFEPGALYCFLEGRYFVKPPRAPWDAHPARWAAPPSQTTVFRRRLEQVNDGDGARLVADQGDLEELRAEGVAARLERLAGADEKAARAAVAALPALEEACERAYRCSGAIHYRTGPIPSSGLRACIEWEDAERVYVEEELGKEAAKEACP